MKKTIALDFDGVIHAYSKGYHDATTYDDPAPNAFDFIQKLLVNFNVFILSARPGSQIFAWLTKHKAPFEYMEIPSDWPGQQWDMDGVVGITTKKFVAVAYVDDRGVRFVPEHAGGTGFSQELMDYLLKLS